MSPNVRATSLDAVRIAGSSFLFLSVCSQGVRSAKAASGLDTGTRKGKNTQETHRLGQCHLTAGKVSLKIPDIFIAPKAESTSFRAPFSKAMKDGIHPDYRETTIHCACGASYQTRSTRQN